MRKWSVTCSVVSNSLWSCELQPARLLCPWISRQEHWSGLPFPSPEDLPDPRIETVSPASASRFFTIWATQTVTLEPSMLVKRNRTLGKFKPWTKLKVAYAVEENLIFLFWTIFFFTMKNKINIYYWKVHMSKISASAKMEPQEPGLPFCLNQSGNKQKSMMIWTLQLPEIIAWKMFPGQGAVGRIQMEPGEIPELRKETC